MTTIQRKVCFSITMQVPSNVLDTFQTWHSTGMIKGNRNFMQPSPTPETWALDPLQESLMPSMGTTPANSSHRPLMFTRSSSNHHGLFNHLFMHRGAVLAPSVVQTSQTKQSKYMSMR